MAAYFFNDHACCLGIGIDAKQTVIISNCEIVSDIKNVDRIYENTDCAILIHDRSHGSKNPNLPDSHFLVKNCYIKTNRQFAVKAVSVFQSYQSITFQNNIVQNNGKTTMIFYGDSYIKTSRSCGNNIDEMNY